jgi:hypothetical protein
MQHLSYAQIIYNARGSNRSWAWLAMVTVSILLSATSFGESKLVTRYHTTAFRTQALRPMKTFRKSATIFRKRLCGPTHRIEKRMIVLHQFVISYRLVQRMKTLQALSTISDVTLGTRQIMVLYTAIALTLMTVAKLWQAKIQIWTLVRMLTLMWMTLQWTTRNSLQEQILQTLSPWPVNSLTSYRVMNNSCH